MMAGKKQERWLTIQRDGTGSTPLVGVWSSYPEATEDAEIKAAKGSTVEVAQVVAIVRPPPVGKPQWERLPCAPRRRKAVASPLEPRTLEQVAMELADMESFTAVNIPDGFVATQDGIQPAPPVAPDQNSWEIQYVDLPLPFAVVEEGVAPDKTQELHHTAALMGESIAMQKPACPRCEAGAVAVRGKHTDMATGKPVRVPCPRAQAKKKEAK